MPDILTDLPEEALVNAIEANLYASTPLTHGWPGIETHAGPDVCWCVTDCAFPVCNGIFRARLKPREVDKTIEGLTARGRARKVHLNWWIGRDTRPADLAVRLTAHGFTTYGPAAGMAIDLLAMNDDLRGPSGLSISEVADNETLKTWCHVTAVGFGLPERAEGEVLDWFTTDLRFNQPLKFYLGTWQGVPVATSMLFLAEGVAGIYFVATVPEARTRGFGFAITREPLLAAREMGYRVGILQASKMGEPVYRRMGFKKYSQIQSYTWLYKPE